MNTYILFHAGCWDGLVAAWIARSTLSRVEAGDRIFIPVQYDQPAPILKGPCNLYILDFCFPREQMVRWWQGKEADDPYIKEMVVIDHHKTSAGLLRELTEKKHNMPELGVYRTIKFDLSKSGGRLSWEYFIAGDTGMQPPGVVDYTEDRDLWAWKLPGSREVNACLRSYPMTFETLDKFGRLTYQQLYMEMFAAGEAILRRERQIIDSHVQFAKPIKLLGYDNIPVVNATALNSEITGELAKGKPFAASYFDTKDGKRVWSLRSAENGIDVSELAKSVGGGGHKHAAGFSEDAVNGATRIER